MPPCRYISPKYYKCRWYMTRFFRTRVFPTSIQIGEILFFLSIIAAATYFCYFFKDKKDTGNNATYPLAATFVLSVRNSFFTFFFGVSFERQLFWHKLAAIVSVGMGTYHGFEAGLNAGGLVLVIFMGLLIICSFWIFRRK